jgi:hypothetical protein
MDLKLGLSIKRRIYRFEVLEKRAVGKRLEST